MSHVLPPLPYAYDALDPTIDELTMRIHHDRLHATYVAGLNAALDGTEWADTPVEQLLAHLERLPATRRAAVRHHGGGHANHVLFWESMRGAGPRGPASFASVAGLRRRMSEAAAACFGSGWAWLVHDGAGLAVTATGDQDSPLMDGQTPLLGVDVWEHAYYLKYRSRRADYLEAWWNVVDWARVGERYASVAG
jgi:Fe-Mn family superoxide dismutase